MKSTKRQVKTPVGNKTKRGAELEGTPRTPRSLDFSPIRSPYLDGGQEQEVKYHPRSRKPLNWNLARPGCTNVAGRNEDTAENPVAPSQQEKLREQVGKAAELALSPICVNAIAASTDEQGEKKSGKKIIGYTTRSLRKQNSSVKVDEFGQDNDSSWRQTNTTASEIGVKRTDYPKEGDGALTEGSCPSSPDCRASPFPGTRRVIVWSNAAFHPGSIQNERTFSKDSSSSSSQSSGSSSRGPLSRCQSKADAADFERRISQDEGREAEDYFTDNDSRPALLTNEGGSSPTDRGISRPVGCDKRCEKSKAEFQNHLMAETPSHDRNDNEDTIWKRCEDVSARKLTGQPVARKILMESLPHQLAGRTRSDESSRATAEESNGGKNVHSMSSAEFSIDECEEERVMTKELEAWQERGLVFSRLQGQGLGRNMPGKSISAEGEEKEVRKRRKELSCKASEAEIEQEIERLTRRLRELKLRKKQQEAARRREEQGKGVGRRVSNASMASSKSNPQTPGGRQKEGAGRAVSCPRGRVKAGQAAAQGINGEGRFQKRASLSFSKGRDDSSVGRVKKSVPDICCNGNGVSETKRFAARNGGDASPAAKVSRRLSLSSAIATARDSVSKPSPRFVSSRYATPVSSKKRDRSSETTPAAATATPSPSPLKKVSTLTQRHGYPSRSGLTPLKHRLQPAPPNPPSPQPSKPIPASSPPVASSDLPTTPSRSEGPKSTAALYQCLEALVQDSKHFFQKYPRPCSPKPASACLAQPRPDQIILPDSLPIAVVNPHQTNGFVSDGDDGLEVERKTLPRINTRRIVALSPRDSGCVKRMPERQKKQSFFGKEESDLQMQSDDDGAVEIFEVAERSAMRSQMFSGNSLQAITIQGDVI